VARKLLNFAAPALVLGLVVVSQAQGRIKYPPAPAGTLERSVDNILIKERADIILTNRLVTQQNLVNTRLGVLENQLAQATDPAVIASLQRQIAQANTQFRTLGVAITRQQAVLRFDLNVLNPQKDRLLVRLNALPRPKNQLTMFTQAARLQENTYAVVAQAYINRRPLSPSFAF